jgi:diaphanous 1
VLSVGNALNGSTFRGGARGFRLDALLKLRETKTVKGGAECPTLLHYIARMLLRSDPALVTFVEDMPHLEAAARVSVQTLQTSIVGLVNNLNQVKDEMMRVRTDRAAPLGDQFAQVMGPFIVLSTETIDAMKNMGAALDAELQGLLAYYGEAPDASDAPKPEDFFALILSFSSLLQKAALEVHEADEKAKAKATPKATTVSIEPAPAELPANNVRILILFSSYCSPRSHSHRTDCQDGA